jgi:two-component system NtrC family sensor kinase
MEPILIVDDDAGHCANLVDILELEGYAAMAAGTVARALELAGQHWFQVALLDLRLPDGSGTELLGALKRRQPDCYAIIITAHADLDSAVAALDEGAYTYLRKPFRPDELLGLLRRIFESIRLRQQKRVAESALRESEEKLAGLVNAMADAMVMVNETQEIVWANDPARKAFGRDLEGRKYFRALYRSEAAAVDCIVRRCFEDGLQHDAEMTFDGLYGRSQDFWCTANVVLRNQDGRPKRIVLVCRNTTEKKLLQAEVLRNAQLAAIGELAAGIAHEINNPINGIINYAQILIDQRREAGGETGIPERILKEGDRIASIVSKLLAFARDRQDEKGPVDIAAALAEALDLNQTLLRQENILVHRRVAPELPLCRANFQQIQQVFLNVISNARYALNQKHPTADPRKVLEIRCEPWAEHQPPGVRVVFTDFGTGIPGEILDRVLNPFFSTKPADQGTGLGLSISRGIVEDHRGALRIESVAGDFTRVVVDLPGYA